MGVMASVRAGMWLSPTNIESNLVKHMAKFSAYLLGIPEDENKNLSRKTFQFTYVHRSIKRLNC